MKRIAAIILAVCLLLVSLSVSAFGAETISSFDITVTGLEIGGKKSDIVCTVGDERLEISSTTIVGKFGEDGSFLEQNRYYGYVGVKIKSDVKAFFDKEMSGENVRISGADVPCEVKVLEHRKGVTVTFTYNTDKSEETIAKEKAIEEAKEAEKHSHCYCGGYIEAGEHTAHTEVTFKKWNGTSKITYDKNCEAYLYLTEDAKRTETLNVGGGKSLTICLNGHSIQMNAQNRVINVGVGGKLRICDCQRSPDAKICGGSAEYGAGIHNNGTVTMFGGIVTKNNGGYGGGVYNNVNFYLYGGDIYDNKAFYGGGVWNDNDSKSTFTMYNGTISLNTATCGGAVYNNDGATLVLKGGNVNLNVAATAGGGVWNNGRANLTLDGTMIIDNAAKYGGGIWNNSGTVSIISGNISKNVATSDPATPNGCGGGIWNNGGLINMTGGEITFNKAMLGGGVWVNGGSEFVMSNGVIAENEAQDGAGVYIQKYDENEPAGTFRLSDRAGILMNYASNTAGGVYVKGVLNISGEGEVIGNFASDTENADIYLAESGVVNNDFSMPTQFIDVHYGDYFVEPVKWALEEGITSGTTPVTFSPNDKCTRGQVITFLYRLHGSPQTDGFYFADTAPTDYFYDATRWARELKMESGSTFWPNNYCARCNVIRYMWIAAGSPRVDRELPFTDVPPDSNYAMAVAWALEEGITSGTSPTTFSPDDKCTRAEIITFLYRAFN